MIFLGGYLFVAVAVGCTNSAYALRSDASNSGKGVRVDLSQEQIDALIFMCKDESQCRQVIDGLKLACKLKPSSCDKVHAVLDIIDTRQRSASQVGLDLSPDQIAALVKVCEDTSACEQIIGALKLACKVRPSSCAKVHAVLAVIDPQSRPHQLTARQISASDGVKTRLTQQQIDGLLTLCKDHSACEKVINALNLACQLKPSRCKDVQAVLDVIGSKSEPGSIRDLEHEDGLTGLAGPWSALCNTNPTGCTVIKQKVKAYCVKNPEICGKAKQATEKLCTAKPAFCKQVLSEVTNLSSNNLLSIENVKEHVRSFCKKNQAVCGKIKEYCTKKPSVCDASKQILSVVMNNLGSIRKVRSLQVVQCIPNDYYHSQCYLFCKLNNFTNGYCGNDNVCRCS